jgi:hypothetical protein
MSKVVYSGYLGSILVPEVGVFERGVPRDVPKDKFEMLVLQEDFAEAKAEAKSKDKKEGGDES